MPRIDVFFTPPALIGSLCFLILALFIVAVRAHRNARQSERRLLSTQAQLETTTDTSMQSPDNKSLESVLSQGQKLLAVGTLAGGIAHDFNNLLYAIQGYAEMCRQDAANNPALLQNLNKVLEATSRGQSLVARILTFSRRHHQKTTPLSLKDTLEGVLALIRPTIPSSVSIDLSLPEGITVLANQTELHQVIVNLITNAVDAMDGQGNIHITALSMDASDPLLKAFPHLVHPRYAVITVADSGLGMDESTLNRIFEPFFTTKEVGKGTGLGLSIVHSILTEHQGGIRAESELGHGTTFTLLLPEYPKSAKEHP